MTQAAQRATQPPAHGQGAKPRAMVARPSHRTPAARPNAEGLALRAAARLSADPGHRDQHRTYIDGFIAGLHAAGLVTDPRAMVLRRACHTLLDNPITLTDYATMTAASQPIDPLYVRAVATARHHRAISAASLAAALNISPATARQQLERMVDTGVLNAADMFGVHTLRFSDTPQGS